MLPLEGYRVLDFTWGLAGPFCTKLLCDLGMEVIKVERPPQGDMTRYLFFCIEREGKSLSSYYLNLNRGKKSISIDLRKEGGRKIAYKLVEKCDVLVENFQPGVMKKLGFDYDTVRKINPKIVYCSISCYGQYGPYSKFPGYDLMAQTLSGYIWGQADLSIATTSIGDTFTGTHAAFAIVAALLKREKTGEGEYIDISMSDCLLHSHENILAALLLLKSFAEKEGKSVKEKLDELYGEELPEEMLKMGPHHPAYGGYGVYKCKDGYISIAMVTEWQWERLLKVMEPELPRTIYEGLRKTKYFGAIGLDRIRFSKKINDAISIWTSKHTVAEVEEALKRPDVDIPCFKVLSFFEILENEHFKAREMFVEVEQPGFGKVKVFGCPIKLASTKTGAFKPAPFLGEHNEEVLKCLGYSDEEIRKLYENNVIYKKM
jgi:crotonobetainyl-CoA:carnitine CoA-transferase CaiB-like acyl-CoA transferase